MKVRESGMPDEQRWATFFEPRRILQDLDFSERNADVVDFGCGYGTFSLAAARMTAATVYAIDLDPEMTRATAWKAQSLGVTNVRIVERDFCARGTGLADGSVGYAMLFNILHAEAPLALLQEAYRVLVDDGLVSVMHWIPDPSTPRGPPMAIRPRPEQCRDWVRQAGFELKRPYVELPPYHYGVVGQKPGLR